MSSLITVSHILKHEILDRLTNSATFMMLGTLGLIGYAFHGASVQLFHVQTYGLWATAIAWSLSAIQRVREDRLIETQGLDRLGIYFGVLGAAMWNGSHTPLCNYCLTAGAVLLVAHLLRKRFYEDGLNAILAYGSLVALIIAGVGSVDTHFANTWATAFAASAFVLCLTIAIALSHKRERARSTRNLAPAGY